MKNELAVKKNISKITRVCHVIIRMIKIKKKGRVTERKEKGG